MQLQFIQSDFKSEYLFRTCSAATYLVTSLNNSFQFVVLLCCVVLAKYGTLPFLLNSFISAALLQELLQANAEPFRNALVKTWNKIIEMKNRLETSLVPLQTSVNEAQ